MKHKKTLAEKYPPSEACACDICLGYCARPGWWTVVEADLAITAGFGSRMMLEVSPDRSFGVLSPAFKGNEGTFALKLFSTRGCTFLLKDNRCELHNTGFQPLECRFCHHERRGLGQKCHTDIERDWNSPSGRALVEKWIRLAACLERSIFFRLKA